MIPVKSQQLLGLTGAGKSRGKLSFPRDLERSNGDVLTLQVFRELTGECLHLMILL